LLKPVQPVWTGFVEPTLPVRAMTVWLRSSVFGPVGCDQTRWSTPSAVRASATWSVLEPSGVVTRFHGAALAADAAKAVIKTASTEARIIMRAILARDRPSCDR
jgi:hypothetical protein